VAPPVSYERDGVQYFAFQTGWSGFNSEPVAADAPPPYLNDGRLIVLRLGGAKVPVAPRAQRSPFLAIDLPQEPKLVAKGASAYLTHCAICHGHLGEQTLVPDLRRMSSTTYDNFNAIVLGGVLKSAGMASFSDILQASDAEAIRAFIVDWAQRARRDDPSASKMPVIPAGTETPRLPGH